MRYTLLVFSALLFTACGTLSMQKASTISKPVFFQELQFPRTVYMVPANYDMTLAQVEFLVRKKLLASGYEVVDNPRKAHFILRIGSMDANEAQEQQTAKGAIGGAVAAGSIAGAASGNLGTAAIGAAGGAVAGALIGYLLQDGVMTLKLAVMVSEKAKEKTYDYYTTVFAEVKEDQLTAREAMPVLEELAAQKIATIFNQ